MWSQRVLYPVFSSYPAEMLPNKLTRFQRAVLVTSLYPPRDPRAYKARHRRRRATGKVEAPSLAWDAGTRHGFRRRAVVLGLAGVR